MTESFIREDGAAAVRNGYAVVGIKPRDKCPVGLKWQESPLTERQCLLRPKEQGYGILCGWGENPVCGIDADIPDQALSEMFWKRVYDEFPALKKAPIRVGREPKRLLMVRASASNWSYARTPAFMVNGEKCQVEILNKGKQFVAGGIHPKTEKPYRWLAYNPFDRVRSPANLPAAELVTVEPQTIDRIMEIFCECAEGSKAVELVREPGNRGRALTTTDQEEIDALSPYTPVGLTSDQIRALMLPRIETWGDYTAWTSDMMRIAHETSGSTDGLALVLELSRQAPGYTSDEDVIKHWQSFRRMTGRVLTMWPIARQAAIPEALAAELSQVGLLYRARNLFQDRLCLLAESDQWLYFDVKKRKWIKFGAQAGLCQEFLDEVILFGLSAEAEKETNAKRKEEILKFQARCKADYQRTAQTLLWNLKNSPGFVVSQAEFDQNHDLIGFENGVVDLKTGQLLENTPSLKVTKSVGYDYDPDAKCPLVDDAMDEWLGNIPAVSFWVRCLIARALRGENKDNAFLLCVGDGANGKSSLFDLLFHTFGEYAAAVSDATLTGGGSRSGSGIRSGGEARADLVNLIGARIAICSETPQDAFLKDHLIKQLTGNDWLTVRAPYDKRETRFRTGALLIMGTNYLPGVKGDDTGIWRRVRPVRFPRDYENDPVYRQRRVLGFADKLKAEAPGFIAQLIRTLRSIPEDATLQTPSQVLSVTKEYRESMDLIAGFVNETLVEEKKSRIKVSDLYKGFEVYVRGEGYSFCLTKKSFTQRLKRRFGDERFKRSNGSTWLTDVRRRTEADNTEFLE
mgnify:CR=1 FL=1